MPTGMSGELWIGGPMVVAGYWDNREATRSSFIGGYWKSGDIGSIDAEGYVQILDRRKDMLNRGGYKIYSVEVESALLGFPGVLEAAVVARACPVLGERVHAVVSVERGAGGRPFGVRRSAAGALRRASRRLQGAGDLGDPGPTAAEERQRQADEARPAARVTRQTSASPLRIGDERPSRSSFG